jgi:uncharacterized membrane protein
VLYTSIVYIHVLSAIVAVGVNVTYALWLARGAMQREHLLFALRGVKLMDDRIANPAYGVLLLTGIVQVWMSGRSFHQFWIEWALVLWLVLALVGTLGYSRALKRQIKIVETSGPDDPAYAGANSRQQMFGIVLMIIVLVILGLMVFRPGGA